MVISGEVSGSAEVLKVTWFGVTVMMGICLSNASVERHSLPDCRAQEHAKICKEMMSPGCQLSLRYFKCHNHQQQFFISHVIVCVSFDRWPTSRHSYTLQNQ